MTKNDDNPRQTTKDVWAGQAGHRACDQGLREWWAPPLQVAGHPPSEATSLRFQAIGPESVVESAD
jgi:hypothetical protein